MPDELKALMKETAPPRFREAPWLWILGACIAGVLTALGGVFYSHWPILPPFEFRGDYASEPTLGVWRVTTRADWTTHCESLIVDRQFIGENGSWRQQPLPSSSPNVVNTGFSPYAILGIEPGSRATWADYAVRPGKRGELVIITWAWGCDNGWNGRVSERRVPFDWTDGGVE